MRHVEAGGILENVRGKRCIKSGDSEHVETKAHALSLLCKADRIRRKQRDNRRFRLLRDLRQKWKKVAGSKRHWNFADYFRVRMLEGPSPGVALFLAERVVDVNDRPFFS